MNKPLKHSIITIGCFLAINLISNSVYKRFDLTKDKRYTLNKTTKNILQDITSPIAINVFLKGSNFPSEFRRLQQETKQLLEEFKHLNNNINFKFINPLNAEENSNYTPETLQRKGLIPMQLTVKTQANTRQDVIFPWATLYYNNKTVPVTLVKNNIGKTQQELVTNSVQHLEYAFVDGLTKLIKPRSKKIAILKGNNQLQDIYLADFIKTLKSYYYIAPFTLDSVANNPIKTLKSLRQYDLIISVKPTQMFTEKEAYVLDQYITKGGHSLWLVDAVAIEKDSLYKTGKNIAVEQRLNLTNIFFKYGFRINPVLVKDLYSAPITLANGSGSNAKFNQLPWFYSPLAQSSNKHPITNNLNLVKFDFANQIDTLKSNTNKTILLKSSILTQLQGIPTEVSLESATVKPNPKHYNKGQQTLALLLEGNFTSAYKNRVKPFKIDNNLIKEKTSKLIAIADGDVIKNTVSRNGPDELGFDKWTGQTYGNKEFLLNCVNYLMDDTGIINIRSKDVKLAFLNQEKIEQERLKWQLINLLLPLILLSVFGMLFIYFRKKSHTK